MFIVNIFGTIAIKEASKKKYAYIAEREKTHAKSRKTVTIKTHEDFLVPGKMWTGWLWFQF